MSDPIPGAPQGRPSQVHEDRLDHRSLLHRSRRRPRRTRFSGRTTPVGEPLSESLDGRPATAEAGAVKTGAAPDRDRQVPHDADLRVDALEIGGRHGHLPRILGQRLSAKLGPSASYLRRSATFLMTSPGRLTTVALILIIAILASGLSMWQSTSGRQEQLTLISQLSEPMANASQNLYASLTIADASANTAFSRGTLNSNQDLDSEFDDVIARASMSATRAATGINNVNDPAMGDIATVQRLLPTYTGMVETARANARQGNPVSAAYLASASSLMQTQILPAARSLYESTSTAVTSQQRALALPPLEPMSGIAAAIIMLLLTQWWLARRTGRLFNVGLFSATVLMVAALAGVVIATTAPWQGNAIFGDTRTDVHSLAELRIDAQQLRASETLGLVRRQPADAQTFNESIRDLAIKLEEVANAKSSDDIDGAIRAIYNWESGHQLMMAHLNTGDYAGAVQMATDANNNSSAATAFNQFDTSMQAAIAQSRVDAREDIDSARSATAALSLTTITLTVLAAILVVIGFRHRLMEYL